MKLPSSHLAPLLIGLNLVLPTSANVIISEFLAANDTIQVPNAVSGRFDDWVELQNPTETDEDLSGWHLTDDPSEPNAWTFPDGTILPANSFLVVLATGDGFPDANGNLRTNFRLSSGGENILLIRPDLSVASEFGSSGTLYPGQSPDISYGLHPNTGQTVFFENPTPGTANDPDGLARVEELTVSPRRGLYQSAQTITLSTTTPGATIYYTSDGNPPLNSSGNPTPSATAYSRPISISQTTVIRSAAMAPGLSPSNEQAHTYLLFDIDNANPDGTDTGGLNLSFLQQTQPPGYGNLSSGDYNMDPDITRSTSPSAGHGGLTVAQAMLEGLREAPAISISMPPQDFVTIYANSQQQGIAWERACSAEFIPGINDSRSDFQEHCGLRVQGGASRIPNRSPKHSLSFRFREIYGPGRLNQALFPSSEVTNFNSIALRAGYNNSWIHSDGNQRSRGSMIRDQWMRESISDMGNKDAGEGFLAHVFVNGLYWGLHNICERQDNVHYANHNGDDSDLIDARNGATYVNGNSAAWNAMRSTVAGRNWEEIQQVVDIDSYIDFQIIQRYGGNRDLKVDGNWRAAGGGAFDDPTDMAPWKLYSWDGERVLESPTESSVPRDPMDIRGILESMPEYRQRFADRAYRHFTGDGALTPEKCRARWEKYATDIDKAVLAEAARWGDHRRSNPYDRGEWLAEQNRLYNSYFPVRSNNVINALRGSGLYPTTDPPVFSINGQPSDGGYVGGKNTLGLSSEEGTIYYTEDGTDPRLPDGSINPNAISLNPGGVPETLFDFESTGWSYLTNGVAQSDSDVVFGNPSYNNNDWKHPDFNDASWNAGQGLLAGEISTAISGRTANTVFTLNSPNGRVTTAYFRKEFQVTDAAGASTFDLSIIRDDGVIVYLNGREIFRENMPAGTVGYANLAAGNASETQILEHSHSLAPGELLEGTNVLAIEVHNATVRSNDLGIDVSAGVSRANLVLNQSGQLIARTRDGASWSAPATGLFLIEEPASSSNLAISEINYHPRDLTLVEFDTARPTIIESAEEFEFLELRNKGTESLNLGGASLVDGVTFDFDLQVLDPGEHRLLVRNRDAFLLRYGTEAEDKILGTFEGGLDNGGETLAIVDFEGTSIISFAYDDTGAWPSRPDGDGSSLELVDGTISVGDPSNWKPSVVFHGSPGFEGPLSDQRIVINEVSSNSTADFIELHNPTASPIDLTGWFLTDRKSVYQAYTLPPVILEPSGYLTIPATSFEDSPAKPITNYAPIPDLPYTLVTSANHGLQNGDVITIDGYGGVSDFNGSSDVFLVDANVFVINGTAVDNHPVKGSWKKGRPFGLSGVNGDTLWLLEGDSNRNPLAFVDRVDFAAADPDRTLGRWPDGMGANTLYSMTASTSGAANSGPLIGPVVISEVSYDAQSIDSREFVELTNTGTNLVSLNQWRLRGGLDFDFNGSHSLSPGQSLVVVSFDPLIQTALADDFRSHFGIPSNVLLLGPATDGPLNDTEGTVRLQTAGPAPAFSQIIADEVRYLSEAPWPMADNGNSLTRLSSLGFAGFPESWSSDLPTPGTFVAGENYQSWAANNGVGSEDDDDDGDSLENFLEYALGTNPNQLTVLPPVMFDGDTGTITFPSHLTRTGFELIFETSPDLVDWTIRQTISSDNNGSIQINSYSFSRSENPALFWRLTAGSTGG